jgi:hypothetical protein
MNFFICSKWFGKEYMMVCRKHHNGLLSLANFPAESRLKEDLSVIAVYTQVFTVILKAERRDKKVICMVGNSPLAHPPPTP